ncbi:unnamed protein product [Caenorhabditis nigoni]
MNPSQSSLSLFLLLLILMITVSNYLTANRTDRQLLQARHEIQEVSNGRVQQANYHMEQGPREPENPENQEVPSHINVLKYYSAQAQRDLLEAAGREISQEFYQKVLPEAVCIDKMRVGENLEGGKYVCKPEAVNQQDCTIMSLGLNNQIVFDEHMSKVTGGKCTILGADNTEQSAETKSKYAAINGQLFVGKIPETLGLPDILKKSGKSKVDFLKIDIEGGEHAGLEPLIKEHSVCQIFIEIHGSPLSHFEVLQKMAKYNFRVFNVDPSYKCVTCCEYSLINENCMEQYGVVPLGTTIPKPDM